MHAFDARNEEGLRDSVSAWRIFCIRARAILPVGRIFMENEKMGASRKNAKKKRKSRAHAETRKAQAAATASVVEKAAERNQRPPSRPASR